MVINKSHTEHVLNMKPNENHMKKIIEFKKKEDMERKDDSGQTMGRNGLLDLKPNSGITLADAHKSLRTRNYSEPEQIDDTEKQHNGSKVTASGKRGNFIKKKFDISKSDDNGKGIGLAKLKELVKSNTTSGISNPNDLDYLLWIGEPKELAMSITFAQMLNFMNIGRTITVTISTMLEGDSGTTKPCKFSKELNYPLFRNTEHHTRMIPSAQTKGGLKGDMVKLINQNNHAVGLSESIASKAVGVEMDLMTGKSATKMNAVRSKPVDMRQMALKAVMIKMQLTAAYALDKEQLDFAAQSLNYTAKVKTTTEALTNFPSKDIIIDISKLSDDQKTMLLVLCSEWPSQHLISNDEIDIYSSIHLDEENFELYHSQGDDETIQVEGLKMHPKSFWSQCVQLFMNLGGLDDLVSVVRESRGLAPILSYNARMYGRGVCVISPYPQSTCYYGLSVMNVQNRRYIASTILESSTLVLLLDSMMLTLYLNNMLYMCENLGLGSKTLFPSIKEDNSTKVSDILACYNINSGLPSCELMDMTCPWLGRIGRFQRAGIVVLMDIVNKVRGRQGHDLVCCSLNYKVPTKMKVSSVALIQGKQEVDVSKIMGFNSNLSATGPTVKLMNWYNAISGEALPCHGASLQGCKLRGNELPMLKKVHKYKGIYSVDRVMAITEYEPQRTSGGTLKQTFFHNPGYMEAQGELKHRAKPIVYNTNSFSFSGQQNSNLQTKLQEQLNDRADLNTFRDLMQELEKLKDGSLDSFKNSTIEKMMANTLGTQITEWLKQTRTVGPKTSENGERNSTPRGSSEESDKTGDTVKPSGLHELLAIPEYTPLDNAYESGNCGIDALKIAIPALNKEEALSRLGISGEDKLWLTADELAKIADLYDHDLLVVKGPIEHPEWYQTEGKKSRNTVMIYQTDNHFQAVEFDPEKKIQRNTLKMTIEPAPTTEEGRKQMRQAILKGQSTRNAAPKTK
nr:MAG: hypothetical protein [Lestijarvi alphachrysovirus]